MHWRQGRGEKEVALAKERCKGAVLARCENEMCNGEVQEIGATERCR